MLLIPPQIREQDVVVIASRNSIGVRFKHRRIIVPISIATTTGETTV
jgi:hypothetical protein